MDRIVQYLGVNCAFKSREKSIKISLLMQRKLEKGELTVTLFFDI